MSLMLLSFRPFTDVLTFLIHLEFPGLSEITRHSGPDEAKQSNSVIRAPQFLELGLSFDVQCLNLSKHNAVHTDQSV